MSRAPVPGSIGESSRNIPQDACKIPIYVINVDAHTQRWEAIKSRAIELGMDLIRWPATPAAELDHAALASGALADGVRVRDFPAASANAAACGVSHIRLLREVVSSDTRWAVILEDDAVPLRRIPAEIGAWHLPVDADIVMLNDRSRIGCFEMTTHPFSYGQVVGGAGTEGYLISRRGARKLLRILDPLKDPLDFQIYAHFTSIQSNDEPPFFWRLPRNLEADDVELTAYRIEPPLVGHADGDTMIGGHRHPRARFYSRVLLGIGFHGECLWLPGEMDPSDESP